MRPSGGLRARLRKLIERQGPLTMALLAAIVLLGFGLRAYRVVEPLATPGDDARAYYALSKSLYEDGSYGGPDFRDSSDWSPGAPLLYAASFYATGAAREGTGRGVEMLLGVAAIVVVFFLGKRIACRPAGLVAALGVAAYPPFIHSTGALMSEPPAILTLPAAVLAFLWAAEERSPPSVPRRWSDAWRWSVPGVLLGLTALIRPEYLIVGIAFCLLAAIRALRTRGWQGALAAAAVILVGFLAPIVPWTVRNAIVLDRLVPISTGGGKALYVGTNLPADGDYQRVKALLVKRYLGRSLAPGSAALDRINPTPLFDHVAARYPDLPRDEALGKVGKENFSHYLGEDPAGYLAMTARKVWRMWSGGVGEAMSSSAGRAVQLLIVALAMAGLGVLAWRRWWWELVAMATPILLLTAVGAASLASSRRNEVLMTLIFPLAGAALSRGTAALLSSRPWASRRASSPPS
jgi:4-amino-4-deoxy-L-arabinose transferase-like glycosyltransferase